MGGVTQTPRRFDFVALWQVPVVFAVDELSRRRGQRYLTLVHQIDSHRKRLLRVGRSLPHYDHALTDPTAFRLAYSMGCEPLDRALLRERTTSGRRGAR